MRTGLGMLGILSGIVLLAGNTLQGQRAALSTLRQQVLEAPESPLRLDSFPIDPSSLRILDNQTGRPVDSSWYRLERNLLYWQGPSEARPLEVSYRILPYRWDKVRYHLDTARLASRGGPAGSRYLYRPEVTTRPLAYDFRGLDYQGTFARGLSFGNRQDLVLNSRFNMQLAGQLGEDVTILAAISDENLPLQPEGNTLQLQELDKVFIRLSRKNTALTAGDYELGRPQGRFINYYKKLQGATVEHLDELGKWGRLQLSGSVAVNRGQFARIQLATTEGNQGPYPLRGNQEERFIVVLAGTEKVWLDGELLERGIEADYIIDYNRADLQFTHQRLITKDSRVIVEFEYSTQSYLQSFVAANARLEGEKHELFFNLASQQDSKNSTVGFSLTDPQKRFLRDAGDQQGQVLLPAIDTLDQFDPQRVSYRWKDTIDCRGNPLRILAYSTDPAQALLRVQFSRVGAGQGNYVLEQGQAANERVYRWVAPGPDCRPAGSFEPVVPLRTPRQHQMVSLGGAWKPDQKTRIQAEVSMSRQDLNRFSPLDAGDDTGMAAFLRATRDFRIGRDSGQWSLRASGDYEYRQRDYRFFNPYRPPEFLRDWGLTDVQGVGQVNPADEHLLNAGLQLTKGQHFGLDYQVGALLRDSLYRGLQHQFALQYHRSGWELDANGSLLQMEENGNATRFFRPRVLLAKTFSGKGNWKVGVLGEREKKVQENPLADSLLAGSFFWDRYRVFAETTGSGPFSLGASYTHRKDYGNGSSEFQSANLAREANLNGSWKPGPYLRLKGNFTYRNLKVLDEELSTQQPAETFLGRTDLNLTLFKGVVRSNSTYELGTGQEPRLEFTFIRVAAGEGDYIWLDSLFNQDGIIQPQEMVIAPFPDQADYVRVTTLTNDFLPAHFVNFNQSLFLNPKAVWFNQQGVKGFLARLSSQSSIKINRKTRKGEGLSSWNPFDLNVVDTALVAITSAIRNVLYFNRGNPVYSLEVGQQDRRSKTAQVSGFESRSNSERFLRGRWNLYQQWTLEIELAQGRRSAESELFADRSFRLHTFRLFPALAFQPSGTFRAKLSWQWGQQQNREDLGGERSSDHQFTLETTLSQPKSSLRTSFSWVAVDFVGKAGSPVGFAMLKGLQPGRNLLWNVTFERQLSRNIRLSLNYEGRKTGAGSPVVHVGRAQVAATF